MHFVEKSLLIQMLDTVWKEHLYALDHLRQGIGLRAYGQRDPLNEYKSEAFVLFNFMLDELKERVTRDAGARGTGAGAAAAAHVHRVCRHAGDFTPGQSLGFNWRRCGGA